MKVRFAERTGRVEALHQNFNTVIEERCMVWGGIEWIFLAHDGDR
jgi:hypothetical protein